MLPSPLIKMSGPVKRLTDLVLAAEGGDFSSPLPKAEDLPKEWQALEKAVLKLVAELKSVRESRGGRETLEKEMKLSRAIQSSLLPPQMPQVPGMEIDAIYRPAEEIGGDYYDFIEIDPDHLGIGIADVSGKSISGAMAMTIVRNTLRSQAMLTLSPLETLIRTERLLSSSMTNGLFVSVFYAVLDKTSYSLTCANAGHLPLLWYQAERQRCEWVRPQGIAFGLSRRGPSLKAGKERKMEEGRISLKEGDMALFYTDGVTEASDPQGVQFGRERLSRWVKDAGPEAGKGMLDLLGRKIEEFSAGLPQSDDMTAVVLRRNAGGAHA